MGTEQRRAILAVLLSGIVLFGWQYFYGPQTQSFIAKDSSIAKKGITETDTVKSENELPNLKVVENKSLTNFELKNDKVRYLFNSQLSVLDVFPAMEGKNFKEIFNQEESSNKILFDVSGQYQAVNFNLSKISDVEIYLENKELGLNGRLVLNADGLVNYQFSSKSNIRVQFQFHESEEHLDNGQVKNFIYLTDDLNTVSVGDDESGDKKLNWFGLDFNYHLFAYVFKEKTNFLYKIKESGDYFLKGSNDSNTLSFQLIYVRKNYDLLVGLGHNLQRSVDFGFMSIIAVPILRGLQFFFSLIPNYGISIILLTIIIRLLTFPLQYKSFKSMKKMQEIQPELTKVREKYKDDPQKLQVETMSLFKKAGANPLGGCLPLLLQMPIFFAFYRVLYSAVELVDAPFYLWIHDLSEKDPYYVLPVLMAIAMFFQQKLTPTQTADPAQQKILMFMPLIFALFMKDMPAGLTLYILVSTILGMAQQLFVYKRA